MMNLSLNARDAMPDGGILRLKLARISASGVTKSFLADHAIWIHITLSDTGTGIDPEVLPRIFEPLYHQSAG